MEIVKRVAYRVRGFLTDPIVRWNSSGYPNAASQLQLKLTFQALAAAGNKLPGLDEVGFKAFSQTDEDGILLYIFSIIGATTKKAVEICAGSGIECNSANLIINHGWSGLLVDGNAELIKQGQRFYHKNRHTKLFPPTLVHSWITRDNVNEMIERTEFAGEIDLLSLDMDGVDYWIWKALEVVEPRVVVVEYQDIVGPNKSLTVPYRDDFNAYAHPTTRGMPNFCGASLPAFTKLAKSKGYRLVGCNRYGYNAFFVRNPLGQNEIPEVSIDECFKHPKVVWGMKERFPTVKDLPWVEV